MLRYLWRTYVEDKGRLALSVGGVGLAIVLMIALDAVFLGAERRSTAYIDHAGADVIVSQSGVRTMHMGGSRLPSVLPAQIRGFDLPGVDTVTPLLFATDIIRVGSTRQSAYVIGLPPDARAGVPWRIDRGAALPGEGGAVIDADLATEAGAGLGDQVMILGRSFRIDGLSVGTSSGMTSVAIIPLRDFATITGEPDAISYVFVQVTAYSSPDEVADALDERTAGVTVQTQAEFAAEERTLIRDMGLSVISIMNVFGFLVGLAVMALTVYVSVLARRAEFGVLKALGASNRRLYGLVLLHALASIVLGYASAIVVTAGLGVVLEQLGSTVTLALGSQTVVKAAVAAAVIAAISALLPVGRIARLDPVMAFRGR